jgi:hypothetical protein
MINRQLATTANGAEEMTDLAVRQALDSLIRQSGKGYAEVSRLIGRNAAYVQQFIKRGVPRRLAEADRRSLAAHFGVPEAALGGPADTSALVQPGSALHRSHEIPFLLGQKQPLTVDGNLVARLHPAGAHALAALTLEGDSMAPTLLSGDQLLVDLTDSGPARDGIYVLDGDSAPMARRLSVNPVTHRIAILSDNAAYPSFPDCDAAGIRILGRVVWVGRTLP